MQKEYRELRLAKVFSYDKVEYFAVTEETLENMENSSVDVQYIVGGPDYIKMQFKVEDMGKILVEQ